MGDCTPHGTREGAGQEVSTKFRSPPAGNAGADRHPEDEVLDDLILAQH